LANKVFVQNGFKILEEFKNFVNENYEGKFELLNFEENVEAAKVIKFYLFFSIVNCTGKASGVHISPRPNIYLKYEMVSHFLPA